MRPAFGLTCILLAAALVRSPFLNTGLGADEGGYAYVVSRLAMGDGLYAEAWIDRPQGLVVIYRALLLLGSEGWIVRFGAVLAGVLVTWLLYVVARRLEGATAGLAAAATYGLVGVAPRIEGFTLNGELAAAVPSCAGVAAAAVAWRGGSSRWLLAAGAFGMTAILVKQSAFDGLAVALVVALIAGSSRRERLNDIGKVFAGAALVLALALGHAFHVGWADYWSAVAGYHLESSIPFSVRWDHFVRSLGPAFDDLAPLLGVSALSIGIGFARGWSSMRLAMLWLAASCAGFCVGGGSWPHYYVQLLPPLCLAAGLGIARVPSGALRAAAVAAVSASTIVFVSRAATDADFRYRMVPYAATARSDALVAQYLSSRTNREDTLYALPSHAGVYFLAERKAAIPYLWSVPLHGVPGGLERLRRTLDGSERPAYVAVYQPAYSVDGSGELGAILQDHYDLARGVPFTSPRILVRKTPRR